MKNKISEFEYHGREEKEVINSTLRNRQPQERLASSWGLQDERTFNKWNSGKGIPELKQEPPSLEPWEGWMNPAKVAGAQGEPEKRIEEVGFKSQQGSDPKGLVCWQPLWVAETFK